MPTVETIERWSRLQLVNQDDVETVKDFVTQFQGMDDDTFYFTDTEEAQIEWDARNVFRDALKHFGGKLKASMKLSEWFEDEAGRAL